MSMRRFGTQLWRRSTTVYRHTLPSSPSLSPTTLSLQNKGFFTGSSLFQRTKQDKDKIIPIWCNASNSNDMVEALKSHGFIESKEVEKVMENLERDLFLPTICGPHIHAMCLKLLENNLQPGMHALDVGSDTGYMSACFAMMVGSKGRVIGLEHIPEVVSTSIKNVEKSVAAPLLKNGSLVLDVGDERKRWLEFAPYDAIHVRSATACEIPKSLTDLLKPGVKW